jgi:hypothetical protein
MSTPEDIKEDGKREDWENSHPEPDPCNVCGRGRRKWDYLGCDPAYGADADGRGGVRLTEWECECGNLISVIG